LKSVKVELNLCQKINTKTMNKFFSKNVLAAGLLFVFQQCLYANVSIPEIFSDNMVLQRRSEVTFWGWAKTGETVTIKADWISEAVSVQAGSQGTWKLVLKTSEAGGPYTVSIKGYNELTLRNVLIGEVWLCSGQSNMEWSARSGINNAEQEINNSSNPSIRLFSVFHSTSLYPQDHLTGEWAECSPATMANFSIIAYFFARKLNQDLGIPVGVINSSWGGTPAESWMPGEVFQMDDFLNKAAFMQKPVPWGPVEPARIYNSMISPLIPFRIAGVLWYQGEANTINAYAYKEILSGLIRSWRTKWGYDFPFYFAQIAPYRYGKPFEGVEVRDAQRRVLEVSGTGMVVLSDIGDTTDIHPRNKLDAAIRFANLALNRYYGAVKQEDSGPLYKSMEVEKDKAVISFDYSDGLHAIGGKVSCFEVAGADGIYYIADAKIKDQKVIVWSDKVKTPVSVRFAWSNTATPNLFNGAGLPASCFISE
jgi:sialate O-acetylesterase